MNDEKHIHFCMDGGVADYDMYGNKTYLLKGTSMLIGGALYALHNKGMIASDEIDAFLDLVKEGYRYLGRRERESTKEVDNQTA